VWPVVWPTWVSACDARGLRISLIDSTGSIGKEGVLGTSGLLVVGHISVSSPPQDM